MTEIQSSIQPLTPDTFDRLRKLIYETTNISMRDSKHILVANRLRKRILALNLGGYEEYYRYLTEGAKREEEIPYFVDAVSTNETFFFRELNHFNCLRRTVLPELFKRKQRIRIWSAGCSTGEEAYTLQIVLEEGRHRLWDGDADIVATDLSGDVIRKAREGVYRERSLREVPRHILDRYFLPVGSGAYRIADELARKISFRTHNLLKERPPSPRFDIIFCRNVMIYFDKPTQRRLADDHFDSALLDDGYLFIGHSESLTGQSTRFAYQKGMGVPLYRKRQDGET